RDKSSSSAQSRLTRRRLIGSWPRSEKIMSRPVSGHCSLPQLAPSRGLLRVVTMGCIPTSGLAMRRREFIKAIVGTAAAWPHKALGLSVRESFLLLADDVIE